MLETLSKTPVEDQIFRLNAEIETRSEKIVQLDGEIKIRDDKIIQLDRKLKEVEEQLAWFKRQIFGKSSEKIVSNLNSQQLMFEGFENLPSDPEEKKKRVSAHDRRKPNRDGKDKISLTSDLPVETIILDVSEDEKICKDTGQPLVKIGQEVTHKLAHKPGSYYIKEIIRPKYAHPIKEEEGITTADLPEALLPKCRADESFLADILTKKFGDHLPLYRQSEILSREGINISRQLLSQWICKAALALKPIYNKMWELILSSGNVFCDETPVDMLSPGKGKTQQGYMWVLVGGQEQNPAYRVYQFYENRKHINAATLLKGYSGVLHSDKYGAYESLANTKQFIWCPCWVHIRRKFFDAESGNKDFRDWVLEKIRDLFALEEEAWDRTPEIRLSIRQEKEVPIIDELIIAIKKELIDGAILPKSKYREALGYFCSLIPYLKNYIHHPFSRLDNNVAERAIRPLAVGRKNWLFVGSEGGGEAAAISFSIVQSCRAMKINPREYLEDVMRKLMEHPYNRIEELLPHNWKNSP